MAEMPWRWRKPALMSVRKIDGRTGEKTGARIANSIDGRTDGKIGNSIAVRIVGKIDSSTDAMIIAPIPVASFVVLIAQTMWPASMAVKGARTPV